MADPHLRGRQVKAQLGAVRKASAGYQDMQRLLDRYAIERFLYRLGRSLYADQLILKGAMLLAVYIPDACRSTRDADFLGFGRFTPQALKQMLAEICADEQDDGLTFDVSGTIVQAAGAERAGTRRPCRPTARSGRQVARLRGQAGADIPYRPCGHNERYRTVVSEESNDLWGQRSLSNHWASGSPWTSATCTRLVAPGGCSLHVRTATGAASAALH